MQLSCVWACHKDGYQCNISLALKLDQTLCQCDEDIGNQHQSLGLILSLPQINSEACSKPIHISWPQFSHLPNGNSFISHVNQACTVKKAYFPLLKTVNSAKLQRKIYGFIPMASMPNRVVHLCGIYTCIQWETIQLKRIWIFSKKFLKKKFSKKCVICQ